MLVLNIGTIRLSCPEGSHFEALCTHVQLVQVQCKWSAAETWAWAATVIASQPSDVNTVSKEVDFIDFIQNFYRNFFFYF